MNATRIRTTALGAALDGKLDMQAAIDLSNRGSRNGPAEIEKGTELEAAAATLKAMGHDVRARTLRSHSPITQTQPPGKEVP